MPTLSTIGAACARAWGFTSGLVKDQYFNLVSLLLPGNGTNGAQNNTFLDGSSNNFTITRNGNTTQGTFSPFSQTGWGNYFNGSSYINAPSINFSTSDFTIEFFINAGSLAANQQPISGYTSSGINYAISIGSANEFRFFLSSNGTTWDIASAVTLGTATIGKWHHIVIVRSGSSIRGYFDGTGGTTVTSSAGIYNNGVGFYIGAAGGGGGNFTGYLSNVRVLLGTAAYSPASSTITVPTAPFATGTTNQVLLTCQANRFVDSNTATTAKTITVSGSAQVTPFSPFAPTQSYSAAAVGGSGYFDGTGDYLQIANSNDFDTNSTFTLECWVYTGSSGCMLGRGGGAASWSTTDGHQFILYITGGVLRWQFNSGGSPVALDSGAIPLNSWVHCAVGYNGTTTRLWLNGVSAATSTSTYTLPTTRNIIRSGATASGDQLYLGYISGLRFVKSDVYGVSNTNIPIPTAPLTAITNTSLLLNFTNAGITDATAKNVLETVGNAQISTTQSKWGGGSMSFDGTGDYLINGTINSSLFQFGSGDFTVEMWIYPTTVSVVQYLIDFRDPATSSNAGIQWFINSSAKTGIYVGDTAIIAASTTSISANVWTHLAVVRNGSGSGNYKLYINGTADATTGTNTTSLTQGFLTIAANANNRNTATTDKFNGYIDDLRVTRVARYTSNFTAPTAPFPVQ